MVFVGPFPRWPHNRRFLAFSIAVLLLVGIAKQGQGPLTQWDQIDRPINSDIPSTSPFAGYNRSQTCQFPVLDPFDASVLKYVKHPMPQVCGQEQPPFLYVIGDTVYLNRSEANVYRLRKMEFRRFSRANGTDSSMLFLPWYEMREEQLVMSKDTEFKGIYGRDGMVKSYTNVFPVVTTKKTTSKATDLPRDPKKLNVIIFGLDSISRSNFIRNLPLTYDVLQKELGGWIFQGYSKVGDNTFPNMAALLTGHKVTVHSSELLEHFQNDFIDNWPFVWKNYSRRGYVTALVEEQPGIFSYKAKGFSKTPTDLYLRPLGLQINSLAQRFKGYCFAGVPEAQVFLDAMYRFIKLHRQIPHFLTSFLWKLSHDYASQIEKIDLIISKWFQQLIREGLFDDSVVFVMSDHGNRFDKIRSTLIGRYEERMPFLFLHLPPRIRHSHPNLASTLSLNTWRLTCQFDVYETLVDILNHNFDGQPRSTLFNRGVSLFREVPEDRNCADVSIPEHFCVCQLEENVPVDDPLVSRACQSVLDTINTALGTHEGVCSPLTSATPLNAQRYTANNDVVRNIRYDWMKRVTFNNVTDVVSYVRVTVRTEPFGAVFEALVQSTVRDHHNNSTAPSNLSLDVRLGDISRINAYGHEGDCMSAVDRKLEKYCYCNN